MLARDTTRHPDTNKYISDILPYVSSLLLHSSPCNIVEHHKCLRRRAIYTKSKFDVVWHFLQTIEHTSLAISPWGQSMNDSLAISLLSLHLVNMTRCLIDFDGLVWRWAAFFSSILSSLGGWQSDYNHQLSFPFFLGYNMSISCTLGFLNFKPSSGRGFWLDLLAAR